jgi:hypothetical protein
MLNRLFKAWNRCRTLLAPGSPTQEECIGASTWDRICTGLEVPGSWEILQSLCTWRLMHTYLRCVIAHTHMCVCMCIYMYYICTYVREISPCPFGRKHGKVEMREYSKTLAVRAVRILYHRSQLGTFTWENVWSSKLTAARVGFAEVEH